ncbi:MAG: hypothetical protein QNJ46_12010 [Leptolyngbyaceae cyanobacterium MO_188.B28]|nr:hypothetical protein [Leptolyngbyaceae cyanobacterium MO_188.B28]
MFRKGLIIASFLLGSLVVSPKVIARPADVFIPKLDQIRSQLPTNVSLRLPSTIQLANSNNHDLRLQIYSSEAQGEITVALFTCDGGPTSCLAGTISAAAPSDNTEREFINHQAMARPITLAPEIQGFLREGDQQTPPSPFSSVMWRQDDTVYTLSFRISERPNLLRMAHLMAIEPEPLR